MAGRDPKPTLRHLYAKHDKLFRDPDLFGLYRDLSATCFMSAGKSSCATRPSSSSDVKRCCSISWPVFSSALWAPATASPGPSLPNAKPQAPPRYFSPPLVILSASFFHSRARATPPTARLLRRRPATVVLLGQAMARPGRVPP